MANENSLAHLLELARDHVPPMHRAGRPFVFGLAAAALAGRRVWRPFGTVAGLGAVACALFFREPRRTPPQLPGVVAAAADGTVCSVTDAVPPAEAGLDSAPMPRVSVFLSVFDVHVQRMPASGTVRRVAYRPGRFLSADLDKASEDNERNTVVLTTPHGQDIAVVQVAGLVARRILCDVVPEQTVDIGQSYGLIRFGSRVDVYLPRGSSVLVRPGQRTIGGETMLARLPATTPGPDWT